MTEPLGSDELLFDVATPIGFRVRTTRAYWGMIATVKYPAIRGREADVQTTLASPDEVRRSKRDDRVYLFYRSNGAQRWICAVAKRLNADGFLITAYRTSNIKESVRIWPK